MSREFPFHKRTSRDLSATARRQQNEPTGKRKESDDEPSKFQFRKDSLGSAFLIGHAGKNLERFMGPLQESRRRGYRSPAAPEHAKRAKPEQRSEISKKMVALPGATL